MVGKFTLFLIFEQWKWQVGKAKVKLVVYPPFRSLLYRGDVYFDGGISFGYFCCGFCQLLDGTGNNTTEYQ
jgi:hypothetical protein